MIIDPESVFTFYLEKIIMRNHILVIIFSLILACGCKSMQNIGESPLQDFKILSFPRGNVPIGAEWLDNHGPKGKGLPQNQLSVTDGMHLLTQSKNKKISSDAKLAIKKLLGLEAEITVNQQIAISLKGLSIVTVGDLGDLGAMSPEQEFIWEAIRVDSFSIRVQKQKKGVVEASFNNISLGSNGGVELEVDSPKVSISNDIDFNVRGSNLFIAFRVLGYKSSSTKRLFPEAQYSLYESTSTVNFPNEYFISFAKSVDLLQLQKARSPFSVGSNCHGIMAIERKSAGPEEIIAYDFFCDGNHNTRYKLAGPYNRHGQVKDELIISGFRADNNYQVRGNFYIERTTYELRKKTDPRAPGW